MNCTRPPAGWWCSREEGHEGPCPTRPTGVMNDHMSIEEFARYTVFNWSSGKSEKGNFVGNPLRSLFIMATGIAGEAGEVSEILKKHVRDGDLSRDALKKELGDVLHYLVRIGMEFGITPTEIMLDNVEKIASRKERGTFHGSGDYR